MNNLSYVNRLNDHVDIYSHSTEKITKIVIGELKEMLCYLSATTMSTTTTTMSSTTTTSSMTTLINNRKDYGYKK
jgi:hypothetical protein